ncbi:MAG TPA: hypothetical protein VNF46_05815 [Gammaproteobacteria bacterium]|nr:hypothetical protein [Gammaproteobacteria bacterium]
MQILKDLWKNKPLLIVVVVVVAVLIYLLYKSNQNAIVAPGGNAPNSMTHTHVGGNKSHRHTGQEFPIPTGGGGMGN